MRRIKIIKKEGNLLFKSIFKKKFFMVFKNVEEEPEKLNNDFMNRTYSEDVCILMR